MKKRTRDLESLRTMVRSDGKKFVRLDEGAALYSIGLNTFRDIARDAGAIYRVKRIVLVNTELIDEFLECYQAKRQSSIKGCTAI